MNLLCSEQVILNDDTDLLAATVTITTSDSSVHSSASSSSSSSSSSSVPSFYAGVSTGVGGALYNSVATGGGDMGSRLLNTAGPDPTFLDDRCLENLLRAEEKYSGREQVSYFNGQRDITPEMRKIVAEWMMEVSGVFVFFLFSFPLSRFFCEKTKNGLWTFWNTTNLFLWFFFFTQK